MRGCLLCQASAAALASTAVGRDAAGIAELRHDAERAIGREAGKAHDPFDAFEPVANHKSRHECVLLPFEALRTRSHRALASRSVSRRAPVVSQSALSVGAHYSGGDDMRRWLIVALVSLFALPAFAQDLALKRVMLSSGGLGYFEYEATVEGDATSSSPSRSTRSTTC